MQSSAARDAGSPVGQVTLRQEASSTPLKIVPSITVGGSSAITDNGTVLVKVERLSQSNDGVFGRLFVNGDLIGTTVENLGKEIPEGLYDAVIDHSPHLGYDCVHIHVRLRDQAAGGDAGIRIHIANEPCQLEGCVAIGSQKDGDAIDNSRQTFETFMSKLKELGAPPAAIKVLVHSIH